MGKITLNEALKKASVKNDLQMFLGLDAQSELGGMTPERLAAVAGELGTVLLPAGTDMNNVDTNGRFFLANGLNTANSFSYYEVFNVSMTDNSDCYQIAYVLTTGTPVKTRARINGKWTNWVEK